MKTFLIKNGIFIFFGTCIVVCVGIGTWKYREMSTQLRELKNNPSKLQEFAKDDQKTLIVAVGKLMELPSGEEPTIAQVSDVEKLKEQPFFMSAQNGDRVLIYTNAKKAILYRPGINKIIDVAPVSVGAEPTALPTQPSATPTKTPNK